MPVHIIKRKGRPIGARWGNNGKLYAFTKYGRKNALKRAYKQGRAIKASGYGLMPKTIKVHSYKRKGRKVRAHKKKVLVKTSKGITLKPKYRKAMSIVSDKPFTKEHGGFIDFDLKKRLQEYTTAIGAKDYVDVPDNEVAYHTHPPTKHYDINPSPEDLSAIANSKNQQAHIIFRKGKALTLEKTWKANKFKKMKDHEATRYFNNLLRRTPEHKLKTTLAGEGIIIKKYNKKNTPIKLNIRAVEPK